MKVVHIESGLGNQMLSYCEYLALKKLHPQEDIYIETIVFDLPEAHEVINQWNGYELERIFGIHAPNIRDCFSQDSWKGIVNEIRASRWWDKNWNYPVYFTEAFRNADLSLKNIRGDFEAAGATRNFNMKVQHKSTFRELLVDTDLGDWFKRWYRKIRHRHFISRCNRYDKVFYRGEDDIFTGQFLSMKNYGNGLDEIEGTVRGAFKFPPFLDERNCEMAAMLETCNSVAIHARRGDMLGVNGYCYKHGYFRRAVKYIRKRVHNPVFVFFCDTESVSWCKGNYSIFGVDKEKDKIYFVDWNKGTESYRDMQLMSYCRHAVITNSSFGWWGSFFITNPDKITIAPKQEVCMMVTHHC